MTRLLKGTNPIKKWGAMGGVPVSVFEDMKGGKKELDPAKLPEKIRSAVTEIKNNLSQIYHTKSILGFHHFTRRHKLTYVIEELGSCGWRELVVSVCPVCGDKKEALRENLSGIPF